MNKRLKDALNKRFKEFQNCLQIVTFILQEIMIKPMLGKQMGSIKKKKNTQIEAFINEESFDLGEVALLK